MDRLEWLDGEEALAGLRHQWTQLADEHWSPFMQLEWLLPWVEAFAHPGQLRTLVLWRDGRLAAALPLIVEGRRATAPTNKHTPVFEPLGVDPSDVRTIVGAALEAYPTLTIWSLPLDEGRSVESGLRAAASRSLVLVDPWLRPPVIDLVGPAAEGRAQARCGAQRKQGAREQTPTARARARRALRPARSARRPGGSARGVRRARRLRLEGAQRNIYRLESLTRSRSSPGWVRRSQGEAGYGCRAWAWTGSRSPCSSTFCTGDGCGA